jgi:hypothetical protein
MGGPSLTFRWPGRRVHSRCGANQKADKRWLSPLSRFGMLISSQFNTFLPSQHLLPQPLLWFFNHLTLITGISSLLITSFSSLFYILHLLYLLSSVAHFTTERPAHSLFRRHISGSIDLPSKNQPLSSRYPSNLRTPLSSDHIWCRCLTFRFRLNILCIHTTIV